MPNLQLRQLHNILAEIEPVIVSGQIRRIHQPIRQTLTLEIRAQQQNFIWLYSVQKNACRAHLISERLPNPQQPPVFCQTLRKYILGGWVKKMLIAPQDRFVYFEILGKDKQTFALVAELHSSRGNFYLLKNGMIVAALSQYPDARRSTKVGERYELPGEYPQQNKRENFLSNYFSEEDSFPWNLAADKFYREFLQSQDEVLERSSFLKWLKRETRRKKRLYEKIYQEYEEAENYEQFQMWGELLKGSLSQIPTGSKEFTTTNYYDPETKPISIPLNPAKSAKENMSKFFQQSRKLKKKSMYLCDEIDRLEQEQETYANLQAKIESIDGWDEEQIPAEIKVLYEKYQLKIQQSISSSTQTVERKPFWEYVTHRKWKIWVGRSARDNEALTLRHARGNDTWLHCRDFSGSHIVLRGQDKSAPPLDVLVDAAYLAIHYSKAKDVPKVDVVYTQRKYISKPKKSPVGTVIIHQEKVLQIEVDPEKMKKVLGTRTLEG